LLQLVRTEDTVRGSGEAASVAQMIGTMVQRHGADPQRVFVTGLSAGGAMTSVMLAVYPELFAGGAILAGLPHGAAASVQEAFQQMRSHSPTRRTSGSAIRQASQNSGSWPAISIWHGSEDSVVSPSNADAIARQWREVHGVEGQEPEADRVDGYPHRTWRDAAGKLLVEEYRVTGMGHGTPLATKGECGCGEAGAFMLEAGISATVHSAKSWGLLNQRRSALLPGVNTSERTAVTDARPSRAAEDRHDPITAVIEDALRKAGLMK
jgi:poly(hydroxyalkanoate) depolymerase family esterase